MTELPQTESNELSQARQNWRNLSDQYGREVNMATDPLRSVSERVGQLNAEKHADLIAKIQAARDAYYAVLEAEGRQVPHR